MQTDLSSAAAADRKVGRIVCVSGSQIITLLEDDLQVEGTKVPAALQKGRLVKMGTGESIVYGIINGLSVPLPNQDNSEGEARIMEVEVLGEVRAGTRNGEAGFQRGVSAFPALGESVFEVSQDDLALVFRRDDEKAMAIGHLHQDESLTASIVPDDLLGKHFAVLGTTGSGKSCAVTLILQALLARHDNAHIVVLDPHNEYGPAFQDRAEILDPKSLELPFWLLNFEEIEEIILGSETAHEGREAAAAILRDLIAGAKKRAQRDGGPASITADTPIPYGLSDLVALVEEAAGRLDKGDQIAPYLRIKARIQALREDARFGFIFGGISVRDTMAKVLSRLFRIPVDGKPITIVDLSSVPSEILNVVVSVLGRLTFDFAFWNDRAIPLMLVCEEAHRYAPQNVGLGFEPAKRALARIAKEGRKYGVSLCVVSQRPSQLATDVLSQCNTIFALRMTSDRDQEYVRGAISDAGVGLLDFLPSLRNAEAIAVGEGIAVPMRLSFAELPDNACPRSATARFSDAWNGTEQNLEFVEAVVARWRHQKK